MSTQLAEPVAASDLKQRWDSLIFGVRRSIRYHLHRRKFFDGLDAVTRFLLIVSGSTVIGLASNDSKAVPMVVVGAIIALLSSIDLVVGFATKAREYHDLAKAFSELEKEMTLVSFRPTEEHLAKFTNKRLEIEEDEPPTLQVLDMYCHNELCLGMGWKKGELYDIGPIQRLFMDYLDINPNSIALLKEQPNRLTSRSSGLIQGPAEEHI